MSPFALVLRFALLYAAGLAALVYAMHQSGTTSGTAEHLLVFVGALYVASRPLGPLAAEGAPAGFLAWSVAGIAACDTLAQGALAWHLVSVSGHDGLWRSLPFSAVTAVLVQAALAYAMLHRQMGRGRPAATARVSGDTGAP